MSSKSVEDRNIYTEIKKNLNHRIRSIKNVYQDRKCAEIDSYLGYKRSAQVWKLLKNMRRGEKHKTNVYMITMDRGIEYLLNEERTESQEGDEWIYEETNMKSQQIKY